MGLVLGWLAIQAFAAAALFWYVANNALTNFGVWLLLTMVGTAAATMALPVSANAAHVGWAAQVAMVLLSWLTAWTRSRQNNPSFRNGR